MTHLVVIVLQLAKYRHCIYFFTRKKLAAVVLDSTLSYLKAVLHFFKMNFQNQITGNFVWHSTCERPNF